MAVLFFLLSLLLLPRRQLTAQWQLSLVTGPAVTSGHSRDDLDPDQAAILPDHPVSWSLAITRESGMWRFALDGRRITSDLAIRGNSTALVTRDALTAWGVGLEASHHILGRQASPTLWGGLGAVGEQWSFSAARGEARWRAAIRGSLQLDMPFSARWRAIVRAEALAGASLFDADELPDGYGRQPALRAGLLLGAARRW
jgi:hypothetical protein